MRIPTWRAASQSVHTKYPSFSLQVKHKEYQLRCHHGRPPGRVRGVENELAPTETSRDRSAQPLDPVDNAVLRGHLLVPNKQLEFGHIKPFDTPGCDVELFNT
ncbi:hypothetical protein PCASD_14102 [Puccinia coronata f. sp. avenae]|uniref:Uncharacterized protein n=1 Tax=Puccinia coronata f. sp. avenae TaxID=200324 RepID=A0A2N5U741_9BASI|nr:hypothetical protein PCASD_14102 [Puccinia coronata f. sp. avenae]